MRQFMSKLVQLARSPLPILIGLLQRWAPELGRGGPKPKIMRPYVNSDALWRKAIIIGLPFVLGLVCFVYGFFFALTAPFLTIAFAAPIGLLMLLSIWALPDRPQAPTKTMELLFASYLVSLALWPNYLALALPGLPWITAIRLTGIPMALLFLMSLSVSQTFRRELSEVLLAIPGLWIWFLAFALIQGVTVPIATSPGGAASKFMIQQVNWTVIAAVAAWVMRKPGRAERYFKMLLSTAIPMIAIAQYEFSKKHLLWLGHVPPFMKIDDATAAAIFASIYRMSNGLYRAKAVFSTPLGLAEYGALLVPFAIHFALGNYSRLLRIFSFVLIPALFYMMRLTDARLGVLGFLVSVLLYVLFTGMQRFRRNRRDLIGATLIYAYPAVFAIAILAVTAIHPLKVLVLGGGAQAASNAARAHQFAMGLPKILTHPLGFGGGGGGGAMGYGAGEFIAIDAYYLDLGLEYGVLGLATFVGIFLITVSWNVRSALALSGSKDRELTLLIPLAVCMSEFLVIKGVFAQADLHALVFMMVGASSALVWRARAEAARMLAEPEPEPHKVRRVLRAAGRLIERPSTPLAARRAPVK
jgi:hypothetical protein